MKPSMTLKELKLIQERMTELEGRLLCGENAQFLIGRHLVSFYLTAWDDTVIANLDSRNDIPFEITRASAGKHEVPHARG